MDAGDPVRQRAIGVANQLMAAYESVEGGTAARWRALMVAIGPLLARYGALPLQLLDEVRLAWDSDVVSARLCS